MAENFGVGGRGISMIRLTLRDVVQNHLLQILGLVASEPPVTSDADGLHNKRVEVFRAMPDADPAHYVRGQYDGYLSVPGVAAGSQTETYAALKLEIDNWRWSGVPFFIRAGKALTERATEVRVIFKRPPRVAFASNVAPDPDELVLRIDPKPGADLVVQAKKPGAQSTRTVDLSLIFARGARRGLRALRTAPRRRPAGRRQPLPAPGRTASRRPGGSSNLSSTHRPRWSRTPRDRGARPGPTSSWRATQLARALAVGGTASSDGAAAHRLLQRGRLHRV